MAKNQEIERERDKKEREERGAEGFRVYSGAVVDQLPLFLFFIYWVS